MFGIIRPCRNRLGAELSTAFGASYPGQQPDQFGPVDQPPAFHGPEPGYGPLRGGGCWSSCCRGCGEGRACLSCDCC